MFSILLSLVSPVFAIATPNLGVDLGAEEGPYGSDLTLDFHNTALTAKGERTVATFIPMMLSWDFIDDETRPKTFDRLELGLLRTDTAIEDGKMVVGVTFVDASQDYDMGLLDATALGTDVSVFLVEDLVAVGLGLDVRYRAHTTGDIVRSASILHHQVVVGIPVTVQAFTPDAYPWFATGSLMVRPNPVAWGEGEFFVDMNAQFTGGYEVFDGEDVDIRAQVALSWIRDGDAFPWIYGAPQRAMDSERTLRAGMALHF
jgi:hypothetical protein